MTEGIKRAGVLALAAILLPAGAAAQVRPMSARPPAAAPSQNDAQRWYTELQQISARVQGAYQKAMQDPQLRTSQESFARELKAAMEKQDPGLAKLAERVRAMEAEAAAARKRGDADRMQALQREFAQIQARFLNAQTAVMKQPAMAARAKSYEEQLRARMTKEEPQIDQLLQRSKELQMLLREAMGGGE